MAKSAVVTILSLKKHIRNGFHVPFYHVLFGYVPVSYFVICTSEWKIFTYCILQREENSPI